MTDVYERINGLCKENGINITIMCKQLNITRTILSELKSGRTKEVSDSIVEKIANFFNVHSDYIRCKTNIKKNPFEALVGIEDLVKTAEDLSPENYQKLIEYGKLLLNAEKYEKENNKKNKTSQQ